MQDNIKRYEDEVDLRELFRIIWDRKVFIAIFTCIVTFLSAIYSYSKTPIYEVKSVVRIGYIDDKLVESTNIIEQKLKVLFDVDNFKEFTDRGIVTKIAVVKNVPNFLEIVTQATTNEKAIEKNKEVVEFLKKEYKYKIDEFILQTQISVKNIEDEIKYFTNVEKKELEKNIQKIKEQKLPRIEQEIDLLKNVELLSINKKIEFNKKKLKEYEDDILRISKQTSNDNTQNILLSIQLFNSQNLILNLQNSIENLIKEKENLINLKIKDLEKAKENIINDDLKKAEIELFVNYEKRLENLKNSLIFEKLKIENSKIKNSELVGEIMTNNSPIKPKKSLIIIVAFLTGFISSIFLVFLLDFIKKFNFEIKQ